MVNPISNLTGSLEVHRGTAPLADEWGALAHRTDAAPFLRPGWISAWFGAFGRGELEAVAVRREGELVGVLPFVRRGGAVVSAANWHTPLYGPVALDEAARSALLDGLFALAGRRVELSFLDSRDPTLSLIRSSGARYHLARRTILRSPYVPTTGDWEEYWSARSRNLRQTVRRCKHRLEDRGEVELAIADGGEGLKELLEEAFRVEASGWKGRAGTAIESRPQTRRFYEEVASWAAQEGLLCLAFLRVGGRAAAINLSLETASHHYLLKLGHDAEFQRAGAGTVLTSEMIARAFRLKRTYEFLGSDDDYKMRWASDCRERVRVQGFAPTLTGAVDRLVQTHGKAVARRLKGRAG